MAVDVTAVGAATYGAHVTAAATGTSSPRTRRRDVAAYAYAHVTRPLLAGTVIDVRDFLQLRDTPDARRYAAATHARDAVRCVRERAAVTHAACALLVAPDVDELLQLVLPATSDSDRPDSCPPPTVTARQLRGHVNVAPTHGPTVCG